MRKAYKLIKRKLPTDYLKASKKIYKDFGDLYDIPAFAYEDFIHNKFIKGGQCENKII